MARRLFDADDFADRLSRALAARKLTLRAAADETGVSYPTLSRVQAGWPDLSHENFLKLDHWLAEQEQAVTA